MSAFRSETGAAIVDWPRTPDPVDPDAYEASPDPNFMVISARCEASQRSRLGMWLTGFVVAFLVMCLVAGVTLAQQPAPPSSSPVSYGEH